MIRSTLMHQRSSCPNDGQTMVSVAQTSKKPVNPFPWALASVLGGSEFTCSRKTALMSIADDFESSFAMMEANMLLCRLLFEFDMELVNPSQEWESQCHMHVNWLKPDLPVRFRARNVA